MGELALAVAASLDHELVWIWSGGHEVPALLEAAPRALLASHWESVLAENAADAVLVAADGPEEEVADRLRRLAQAAIPVVVPHPICRSMLIYYELDMICQQSGGLLVPYVPARWHPLWDELKAASARAIAGGPTWETLAIERYAGTLDRGQILDCFVRDIELARGIAGDLLRVTAMAGPDNQQLTSLCATLAGRQVVVRWSAQPGDAVRGAKAVLRGPGCEWQIEMPEDGSPWRAVGHLGQEVVLAYPGWNAAESSLPYLARALAGQPLPPTWLDASRGMELADAVERSLQRGRAIDMHYGEHTEAETFKAVMSGAGCLLLVLALGVLLLGTLARGLGLKAADIWPYALAGLLIMFLLAQSLRFVFPPASHRSAETTSRQRPQS